MNAPGLLPLPISPADALAKIIRPALHMLPPRLASGEALVMILAIFLQESGLKHRWQVIDVKRPERKGPARGLAQFEQGTRASRGGVWGVYLHAASKDLLQQVCDQLGIPNQPAAIWNALEFSDALSACLARLLLLTDPKPLPALGDQASAWAYYLRNWRPGQPHPETWPANYQAALAAVRAAQ